MSTSIPGFLIEREPSILICRAPGNERIPAPSRATDGAGGYDLYSAITLTISPKQKALIPIGWRMAIPPGWVGLIRDRSSCANKRDLSVRAGVIDADYRGEVHVLLRNEGPVSQTIATGERIAQVVIVRHLSEAMLEVNELPPTQRGGGGFGSTGS